MPQTMKNKQTDTIISGFITLHPCKKQINNRKNVSRKSSFMEWKGDNNMNLKKIKESLKSLAEDLE